MKHRRTARVKDIVEAIERLAPSWFAESWDNVGLVIGDADTIVRSILVALDVTTATLGEAKRSRANLIVTHHPLIFHPIKSLRASDPIQRLVSECVRSAIAHVVVHTNLDNAPDGLNQRLGEILGLAELTPLVAMNPSSRASACLYKVVTFVPANSWERVRDAMADAGAGSIGNYSHCSFRVRGMGTFKPLKGASPAIGEVGDLEEVEEFRLEMIAPPERLSHVISGMRRVHPYEEVAFDVYPLTNECQPQVSAGTGRMGMLPNAVKLSELAQFVKKTLNARHVRIVGNLAKKVRRIALCTGAGASFMDDAIHAGADAFLTGDIKHHDALRAREQNIALIDPGHATTEKHAVDMLASFLLKEFPSLKVNCSAAHAEPFS